MSCLSPELLLLICEREDQHHEITHSTRTLEPFWVGSADMMSGDISPRARWIPRPFIEIPVQQNPWQKDAYIPLLPITSPRRETELSPTLFVSIQVVPTHDSPAQTERWIDLSKVSEVLAFPTLYRKRWNQMIPGLSLPRERCWMDRLQYGRVGRIFATRLYTHDVPGTDGEPEHTLLTSQLVSPHWHALAMGSHKGYMRLQQDSTIPPQQGSRLSGGIIRVWFDHDQEVPLAFDTDETAGLIATLSGTSWYSHDKWIARVHSIVDRDLEVEMDY